jgi:hypothetical protein
MIERASSIDLKGFFTGFHAVFDVASKNLTRLNQVQRSRKTKNLMNIYFAKFKF